MQVTLDGENIPGLLTDDRGRSYVELYAPTPTRVVLPLVQGSSARRQTLRFVVGETAHPDAQGRHCVIDAFQVNAAPALSFPLIPVVLLVSACVTVGAMLGRATLAARSTATEEQE
jgi:hypothetical protein